jgi:hypothetical protein
MFTSHAAIGRQTGFPCRDYDSRMLFRNVSARAKVHLLGRLPFERGVGQLRVVLLDIELNQFFTLVNVSSGFK